MHDRYSLRFESGEREGEVVPVAAERTSIGRRKENDLQILDGSVSGQHAELVVEASGQLVLRDLGSTNGTRVNGDRIEEARPAHGDTIAIGSVPLKLIDRQLGEAAPTPAAAPSGAGESVHQVSAEVVAKSGRRSRAGILWALVVVVAVGAGGYTLLSRDGGGGSSFRPVVPVEGNLLAASYSFEAEDEDGDGSWDSSDAAPESFLRRGDARHRGQAGMRAELEPGEWARLVSPAVAAREGQTLELTLSVRARSGAAVRAGVELTRRATSGDPPGPIVAWTAWSAGEDQYTDLELAVPVPPACIEARVLVEARAGAALGGSVDADDVGLVQRSGGAEPAGQRGEYRLFLLGQPPQAGAIYKVSRALVGDLHVQPAAGQGPPGSAALRVEPQEEGTTRFHLEGGGTGPTLSLRAEPEAVAGGIATMGPGGYREHGIEFEREEATAILLGRGFDLLALRFDEPVPVKGVTVGAGSRIRVQLGAQTSFVGQLDFTTERALAGDLAHEARTAVKAGRLGEGLVSWRELLDRYPFEEALVAEAEEARARLVQEGMEELQDVREQLTRAEFFRLIDIYRLCRERIDGVVGRFTGSEVEEEARQLGAEVETSLAGLQQDLDRDEVRRLQSILAVLEASEAPRLAAEVRSYLEEQYGVRE